MERRRLAAQIARGYWVTSDTVFGLLEFFEDDESRVRQLLDAYSPTGFVPTAYGLQLLTSRETAPR